MTKLNKSEILGIHYLQINYLLTNLSGYDLHYPNKRLTAFLLKENIDNLFLSCDSHNTKYGHKLIAENLSNLIKKINFN